MYTIYSLIDPRDNSTRYIGITGRSARQRLQQHLTVADGNIEKMDWINELNQLGASPIVKPLEQVKTREEALKRETYWIQLFLKMNAPLTNRSGNSSTTVSNKLLNRVSTKASEEWITINEAARRLGVSATKISALALAGKLHTKRDLIDLRLKLVEYNQVYDLFSSSSKYKSN